MDMLYRLSLPLEVISVAKAIYHDCKCLIKIGGSTFEGFRMMSGVRQGCPLSPLLFVLVVDILLRELDDVTRGCETCIRAFADDVGLVINDMCTHLPRIIQTYESFAAFSGLALNLQKTIVIPHLGTTLGEARDKLAVASPKARHMTFSFWGPYLGFCGGTYSAISHVAEMFREISG
jgi:hypothetical protein